MQAENLYIKKKKKNTKVLQRIAKYTNHYK